MYEGNFHKTMALQKKVKIIKIPYGVDLQEFSLVKNDRKNNEYFSQ